MFFKFNILPYFNFFYFLLLFFLLLPIIYFLLFKKKRIFLYQNLVLIFFLYINLNFGEILSFIYFIFYLIWQFSLLYFYINFFKKKKKKIFFWILLSIFPLFFIKIIYFLNLKNFLKLNFLGISYMTFKSIQILIDFNNGLIKKIDFYIYLQFLLFFPTISSGPIERYNRFKKKFNKILLFDEYLILIISGLHKIMVGFLYKFIISYFLYNNLLLNLEKVLLYNKNMFIYLILYMYIYSMYLYFDFAGYSYFAIGTSYLLGYKMPENFNKPFLSKNIKDFWNRWHMSLSFWFRDYIYMNLLMFLIKKKKKKNKNDFIIFSCFCYLVLFLIMGLWHGFKSYYIIYGIYHAILICIMDLYSFFFKKKIKNIFLTFNLVCFGFLIFSGILNRIYFIK